MWLENLLIFKSMHTTTQNFHNFWDIFNLWMIFLVWHKLMLNSFVQYWRTKFLFPITDYVLYMYMCALIYLPTRTSVPSTRVLYWKSVSAYVESCCGLLWILLSKLHVSWIPNWLKAELHKRKFFQILSQVINSWFTQSLSKGRNKMQPWCFTQ